VLLGVFTGFVRRTRHDRRTQPGIGREHAVKADQMQARSRHQRRQALHEFERRQPEMLMMKILGIGRV
jgi:hypothetical protein